MGTKKNVQALAEMTSEQYYQARRSVVWITADYSPSSGMWFIYTTYPAFITRKLAKEYIEIEGTRITYMVRGFDNRNEAKQFAIDYYEARRDGLVSRVRLD